MMMDAAFVDRRADAIVGSALLRDAILVAKGRKPVGVIPRIRKRKMVTKPRIRKRKMVTTPRKQTAQIPIPPRHFPECCDKCGSPLKPERRLISHIQAEVSAYYKLHPNSMTSQQRRQSICHPRQIAMFLSAELTPKSLPEIGRRFGGRDHTTVIHAIRAVKRRMENDPEVAADVMVLREKLEG